mgnify:FL=1
MTQLDRYRAVRARTEALAAPLSAEDQTVQSMPDCSPTKWHRAHTTWFFETVILERFYPGYVHPQPLYREMFNSYYQAVGPQFPRAARGVVSRPGIAKVTEYREAVDACMCELLGGEREIDRALVELGLHHEQQHQELMLMDINHAFSLNPLEPVAYPDGFAVRGADEPCAWRSFDSGMTDIGAADGFSFDNEGPRHQAYVPAFSLASRLVTNGEWLEFIDAGGYARPDLWLSDGWATCQREGWQAPSYWRRDNGGWRQHTLHGTFDLDPALPVTHVSYYEADAYARFAGARLPTEFEWEHAISQRPGDFEQALDTCWQWTASAYAPYPGFAPVAGVVSEYNGKFMSSQMVLRGGCAFTPPGHTRVTYRNFFYPHSRWMLSGVRLAR